MNANHPTSDTETIVIIGGSGFIGEHLLPSLTHLRDIEIRVLIHRNNIKPYPGVSFVEGDLLCPDSLDSLLSKNCTVINLAYLRQDNFNAMLNLGEACARNHIKRLIHCSTAAVVGRVSNDEITERTSCAPISEYEKTKLQIEGILLEKAAGRFEISILRPTAVFGPMGNNLVKLANQLFTGNNVVNYLRSCLFNRRRMNLVCVENVTAALIFLVFAEKVDQETFIVSDDNSSINNYGCVENRMLEVFEKPYPIQILFIPSFVLRVLLQLAGKTNTKVSIQYNDQKLVALGFKKPQTFEGALDAFIMWYKAENTFGMRRNQ